MATIRNNSVLPITALASSAAIPLPSGAVAGDDAVLYAGHSWPVTTPSGWTSLNSMTGSNWNGQVFSKTLTSGDIATGSVTVSFGGSGYGFLSMVAFVGNIGGFRTIGATRNGTGAASRTVSSAGDVVIGDNILLFGSAWTATAATSTDLTTAVNSSSNVTVSGVTRFGTATVAGVQTVTINYAGAPQGDYQAIVPIINLPPATLWVGGAARETLGSGTAQLRASTVVREALTSGVVAAVQLQTGGIVRETLGSGTAQLKIAGVVRETLVSSKSGRRRYVLVY
jgi:hypothetical protein